MDKYDDAIAYLTENPRDIHDVWNDPDRHFSGCLFSYTTPTGHRVPNKACGCLTQVKSGSFDAHTPQLTEAIRSDERIPLGGKDITVADLHVFAEWQRRIDKELNREM